MRAVSHLPKAGVHRGALKRDRRFCRFHRRRDRAGCGVLNEIPLESRVGQVPKAQTKPWLADRTTLETPLHRTIRLLNFLSRFETLLCCALPSVLVLLEFGATVASSSLPCSFVARC
jgi:hypothetical protein